MTFRFRLPAEMNTSNGRWTPTLKVVDAIQTPLAPGTLFDLLADPQGCLTWHAHPTGTVISSIDAPPGIAVAGTEFRISGQMGKFPMASRTVVTRSERPQRYETDNELVFDHPRLPSAFATERYLIEADGTGSTVRYETEVARDWTKGTWLYRLISDLYDRFFATSKSRRCFRELIKAAERHASYTNSH
jgi:polyketide cyclase/dehydrase/lipid transport protein